MIFCGFFGLILSVTGENKTLTGYYYGLYMRIKHRHVSTTAWKVNSTHLNYQQLELIDCNDAGKLSRNVERRGHVASGPPVYQS